LREVANSCYQKAHYAYDSIKETGFKPVFSNPFYNEFVIECPIPPKELNERLLEHKIIGGFELGKYYPELKNAMLFCVTENNTKKDIDRLVEVLRESK